MFESASVCKLCARCPQLLDVATACWREHMPTQVLVVLFWGYLYHLSPAIDSLATLGHLGWSEDETSKGSEKKRVHKPQPRAPAWAGGRLPEAWSQRLDTGLEIP